MTKIKFIFASLFLFFLIFGSSAIAQNSPPPAGKTLEGEMAKQVGYAAGTSHLSLNDPQYIVVTFIKVFLGVLGTIFFAQIVYAGYLWMTAGGEEKKAETAQKYIKNGIIGLVIILMAYGIVLIVTVYVLRGTTYGPINPYQLSPSYPQY